MKWKVILGGRAHFLVGEAMGIAEFGCADELKL
jgi:hypothetical protein